MIALFATTKILKKVYIIFFFGFFSYLFFLAVVS